MWEQLKNLLISEGEPILSNDLDTYVKILTGEQGSKALEGTAFDAVTFAEGVLGFEDFMPDYEQ